MTTRELYEARHGRRKQAVVRTNFYFFTLQVMHQLFPDELTSRNIPYLEAMCHAIQDVIEGRTPRLLITIPPRHLKSTCVAVALPAYVLGLHPNWEIMVLSYGDELLKVHSDQFRQVIASGWYKTVFPELKIKPGQNRADEIVTTKGGRRKATSLQGAITGRGAHLVIMDDLMKADDIHSETRREQVRQVYEGTIRSRQNDQRTPREIAVQQRLGVDDFAGFLIEKGTFRHFNLPLIAEADQSFPIYMQRAYIRLEGDILNPERTGPLEIEDLRQTAGERVFQCQYQQNPEVIGNQAIRFEDIPREKLPDVKLCAPVVQSWDPAFMASSTTSYSVCTTWGRFKGKWYLLDVMRKKLDYVDLKRCVVSMMKQWKADKVVIELDGSGGRLVEQLREDGYKKWVIGTKTGMKNKEERLIEQSERLINGSYVFPDQASWLQDLRREFMAFPDGTYKDQVDSISQFIAWINNRRGRVLLQTDPKTGRRQRPIRGRRRR